MRRSILTLASLFLGALPAPAKDAWSEPFAGVRCLHRTTDDPKENIRVCFVDLTEPGVRLDATAPEDRGLVTSAWAKRKKAQVAVNGGFFAYKGHAPTGLAVGEGQVWTDPGARDNKRYGQLAEGNGRIEILAPELTVKAEPWMQNVISGSAQLVKDGAPVKDMTDDARMNPRHPRTAVGLSKDRKTLILLVVDGRQDASVGMTGKDLQRLFVELGAWDALNFDGGGSSAMYVEGEGVVNKPSEHRERAVANHLGVFAAKGPAHPKGEVKGFVKEQSTGKPLAGAKVAVTPNCFDTTDEKGFFWLSEVPAGEAGLTITLDGYRPGQARAKVEKQKTEEVAIELASKALVAGKPGEAVGSRQ